MLYTRLVSALLFPLHEWAKGHRSVSRRRQLERSQWLVPHELRSLQLRRLRDFVDRIGRTVPYYRDRFADLGLSGRRLDAVEQLAEFPLLTKDLIRRHAQALRAGDAGVLKPMSTGGSSGEPLRFLVGRDRISHDVAAKWRATRWWGVDIGDPELVVWGSPIELSAQDRLRVARDRLLRTSLLPAFSMGAPDLDRYVDRIRSTRPRMLFGYPSSLALIAAHAERHERCLDDLGIRVAFVTSERLYDHQRDTIARVFGCPVANGYGGRDAGFIAHECPAGGMHISAEDIVVETVDSDGRVVPPGRPGEIVVTHLATHDFPFLRYRTGDIGVLSSRLCACGRGLPLLEEVQGRTTDFVVAADGTPMHALALIYVVRELPGIARYRIEQLTAGHTRVLVVPEADYDEGVQRRLVEGLRARLGASVRIDVQRVGDIAAEPSGKFRYVVSRVVPAA